MPLRDQTFRFAGLPQYGRYLEFVVKDILKLLSRCCSTPLGGRQNMRYDFRNDKILGPAFDYWQAKCGARAMPRRRDIDPADIYRLLPNLQITELVDGGRIRYRLAGTAIVQAYGAELTGKYFDEVFTEERLCFVKANYHIVCREKRPLLVCNRYLSARDAPLICTRMVMPLSEDGINVNQCLTAMSFHYPGHAFEWFGEWFGNTGNFDFTNSYSETIK